MDNSAEQRNQKTDHIGITVSIPPDFIGFKGHFPQNPIFPGICQIQLILAVLESKHNACFELEKILRAKFMFPVKPGEEIEISIEHEPLCSGAVKIKSELHTSENKIASMELKAKIKKDD